MHWFGCCWAAYVGHICDIIELFRVNDCSQHCLTVKGQTLEHWNGRCVGCISGADAVPIACQLHLLLSEEPNTAISSKSHLLCTTGSPERTDILIFFPMNALTTQQQYSISEKTYTTIRHWLLRRPTLDYWMCSFGIYLRTSDVML